jgi:hypothetical protein
MKFEKTLHVALDELRMQMLGTQVLFGFQLQGAFQERFALASREMRLLSWVGLCCIVVTLGLLLAAPCQHRLVERGLPTVRIFRVASRFADVALLPLAIALACDFFVVTEPHLGARAAVGASLAIGLLALSLWYGLGIGLRRFVPFEDREGKPLPRDTDIKLHERIDQMLTEARVVLPGAQALLGFQFAVTLTKTFAELSVTERTVHFVSLCAIAIAIMILLTPATIHRLTFAGRDAVRFHTIGSVLVTAALAPILVGVATDFYVATVAILHDRMIAIVGAALVAVCLGNLWYAVPLWLRRSSNAPTEEAGDAKLS